jgi:hypothetical protein
MSAGRSLRRQLDEGLEQPARFVGVTEGGEMWVRGRVAFVVPVIPDGAAPELKDAIERRRRASLTGHCLCGERVRFTGGGRMILRHEVGCNASDQGLARLVAQHGWPE